MTHMEYTTDRDWMTQQMEYALQDGDHKNASYWVGAISDLEDTYNAQGDAVRLANSIRAIVLSNTRPFVGPNTEAILSAVQRHLPVRGDAVVQAIQMVYDAELKAR